MLTELHREWADDVKNPKHIEDNVKYKANQNTDDVKIKKIFQMTLKPTKIQM